MNQQEKEILILVRMMGELNFLHDKAHAAVDGGDAVTQEEEGMDAKKLSEIATECVRASHELMDAMTADLAGRASEYWFESSHQSPLPAAHIENRWKYITSAYKKLQESPPDGETEEWWDSI
jgi:hypothetical protein